jgi:hypothetical protein
MDFGWSISLRQPGKEFNEQRKVFRKGIGAQSVSQYDGFVNSEAEQLVKKFSTFSGDPMPAIERCARYPLFASSFSPSLMLLSEPNRRLID